MSETQIQGEVEDEVEATAESGSATGAARSQKGYDAVALRELRRARKLVRDVKEDGQISPEANIAIGIANVLALLELASAIREHGGASEES